MKTSSNECRKMLCVAVFMLVSGNKHSLWAVRLWRLFVANVKRVAEFYQWREVMEAKRILRNCCLIPPLR